MTPRIALAGLFAAVLAAVATTQEKKVEPRKGTVTGQVTAKGDNWIEVKADGEEKARRYVPHWRGGAPADGGGPDKDMLAKIKDTPLKSRVKLDWEFEERARVVKIEVLKKPDGKKETPAKEPRTGTISGEIKAMIDALASGTPIEALARYFEYWLLRLQGVYPGLACAECGTAFGIGAAALMPARQHVFFCGTCAPPGGGTALSPESIAFLLTARRLAPEKVERVPLTPAASRELETAHRRLIGLHLEKELKSARVLREMRQAR